MFLGGPCSWNTNPWSGTDAPTVGLGPCIILVWQYGPSPEPRDPSLNQWIGRRVAEDVTGRRGSRARLTEQQFYPAPVAASCESVGRIPRLREFTRASSGCSL